MVAFETFSGLQSASSLFLGNSTIEIVDPGVPLHLYDPADGPFPSATEWDTRNYGTVWKTQPSVRKVVSFVARAIASTPLHLYERVGENDRRRVRDGALASLLVRPSRAPAQTPYRFWESILIDGLLNDRWCAHITELDDGYELIRVPARLVKFKGDYLGRIESVLIADENGKTHEYDPSEFIIDVGYSERSANGTSPLKTLADLLADYTESVAYRRSLWENGARMPGVLERPNPWSSDAAFERFKRSWDDFKRGGGRAGGTPILEDGMEYKPLDTFRPKDTLDLEGRVLTDVEVASAYHVPPELVGAREGTFANVRAFKQMLYAVALGPYYDAWQQTLNASLLPLLGRQNEYIEANVDSKLRGSFEEQADVMSTAIGAPWLTRNEGRALQNLPAVENGDELITPLNVLVGGQPSPQSGKTLDVIDKFLERQQRVVKARGEFQRERWEHELSDDLAASGLDADEARELAQSINAAAYRTYREADEQ